VRPPQALVNRGFADLHAEPDPGSERVDQAHYGERFTLLGREDEWFFAQGPDHYFGWIWAENLDEVAPPGPAVQTPTVQSNGLPSRVDLRAEVIDPTFDFDAPSVQIEDL